MIEKFKVVLSTWASVGDIEMFYVLSGLKSMFSVKSNGSWDTFGYNCHLIQLVGVIEDG